MAINRQQTQSVNIPGIGEIEIKIPEPHTSTRTNTRNDEWDFLCPDWQPGDSCRGYYPRPEWWTYFGSDWHFLMIAGYINIEGQPTQDYPCAAPQYWADLDGFHLFISDLPYLEFSNSCSANCNYYCMDNGFGNVGNYISDYTSPSFIPDSDEGFCNCYCTSTPYDCVINQNSEEEGSHYPNKAHTGPHVATDRADAIGIFYTHPPSEAWPEGRRVLFGWNYVGGINGGDSEPNLSYPEQVISGVIIMTQLWASETAGGMFSEPTSHYPPDGTQLTIDNTEIIYYRATTNTFHAMSDESLQNILTINPYAPDTTWDGVLQNNMINFIADAGIGNFQYEYDEYGNQVMITDYGNMYQLNFGPPISNAIPLPPQETITDCRTDEDCRDGFICHAGKCVRPNVVPISRTTPGRQQSNRGGNIRGGQGIPGCTNPNALNFNPLATGCPPENPACCLFEEPYTFECNLGDDIAPEYGDCYGPVQTTEQTFLWIGLNRNDSLTGCGAGSAPGEPNEDFSNYCNQIGPEQGGFGYVWYNEPCCSNDSYPINAEYWDVNNDMNFPILENVFDENISWEPGDQLMIVNCGESGTECANLDPLGPEMYPRISALVYVPPTGYQCAQQWDNNGLATNSQGNPNPEFPHCETDSIYFPGEGWVTTVVGDTGDSYSGNYISNGDRFDIMIFKRSRGLFYRSDNFDNGQGNLIFPKFLNMSAGLIWEDWGEFEFGNNLLAATKVLPLGGVQVVGCMDPEAYNYVPNATLQEPGQCNYDFPKEGCTNSMCDNYESDADLPCMTYDFDYGDYIPNGCCINCFGEEPTPDYSDMPVGGCMDSIAYNYNPNATYDNGTCNYDPISYISCETDEYCQTELSPTYRCVESHGQGRVCLNFAGDVSGDNIIDYTDICMMASHILQTPIQHELCSGLVGAGGVNPSTVFTDPISPDMFQFGDLDEDGIISISDFIAVTTLFVYQTFNTYSDFNQALDEIETMFGLSDYVLGNQSQSRPRPIRSVNQDRIISSDRTRTTPSKQQSQRQSVNIPDVGEIEPAQQMIYDYFKQQNLLDNQPYTFMMENGQVNEIPITDMDGAPDLTGEPCIFQPFGWPEDGTLPATRYYVHNFNSTQTTDDEFNIIDPDPSDPVSENIPECWPLISNPSDCYAGVSMTWYCLPSSPEYQLLDCEDYEFSYMTGYGCSINDIPCIAAQADACESQRGCTWTAPYFCQHIGQYGSPTTNINCVGTCCPVEGEWDANCDGIDDATFEQTGECESLYQSSGMICPDGSRNTWGQCGPRSWSKLMGPDGGCGHSSYQNNPRACDESQCGCKYCHTSDRCLTIEEHNATCEDDMCSGISVEIFGQEYDINTTTVLDLSNNQLTGEIPPEIGCLTNLTQLKVSFNNLSGPLPPEMQQLTNLISLELDHTYLSGEIPTWIGNLNLNRFNIYGSSFTGVIPEEICNWFVEPFDGDVSGSYFDYNDEWIVVGNVDVRNNFLSPFWPWCFTLDLVSGQMTGAAPPAMYLPQQNGDRNGEEITQTRQTTSTRNYVVNDNLTGQQNLKKKQILINKIKKQQKNN